MTRTELTYQIEDFCGEFAEDFDIHGIVSELFNLYPNISSIDDVEYEEFVEIVQRHDRKYCQDHVSGEKITLAEYCRRVG